MPAATISTTPGIVNRRSLAMMPSIVFPITRASRVRSALRFQKMPVVMLPRNMITAPTCTSLSTR